MTRPDPADERPMVAHLDWRDLISVAADTPAETLRALDNYFAPFARPEGERIDGRFKYGERQPCIKCDAPMVGNLVDQFIGSAGFTWGLVHGEGHCRKCGWPARLYHFIKDENGADMVTIRNLLLQYHPDFVSHKPAKATA